MDNEEKIKVMEEQISNLETELQATPSQTNRIQDKRR
jgi:predicted  nucleic acid-binding Zn-ribbon protein